MSTLSEKVKALLPELLARGPVYLFALFERDDASGKWDVVLSAEWADRDASSVVRDVSAELVPKLTPEELSSLSRVVIIPSRSPAVSAMTSAMNVSGGQVVLVDTNVMGLQVKNAYVFRAQRTPAAEPSAVQ